MTRPAGRHHWAPRGGSVPGGTAAARFECSRCGAALVIDDRGLLGTRLSYFPPAGPASRPHGIATVPGCRAARSRPC